MMCPLCPGELEPEIRSGVEIDRCGSCAALWFDATEFDAVRGQEWNGVLERYFLPTSQVADFTCPRCEERSVRRGDISRTEVLSCGECRGLLIYERTLPDTKRTWAEDGSRITKDNLWNTLWLSWLFH